MTPASLTRRATDGFCTTFSTGTVQTMPGTSHSTSRFATPPRSRSAGRNTRRALRRPHMRPRLYQLLRCRRRRFTMSVDHASGDASRGYAKWATQVFRAAPPPAVQDWGWPKFAAHTELRARDLIGTDGALRVRATVTVSVSSTDIARSDADACLLAAARTGAADAVRRCLRAGADAAHRDVAAGSARTPLHLACARGHRADADTAAAAIVPVLAAAGADIDAEDAHGETALHLAVRTPALNAKHSCLTRAHTRCERRVARRRSELARVSLIFACREPAKKRGEAESCASGTNTNARRSPRAHRVQHARCFALVRTLQDPSAARRHVRTRSRLPQAPAALSLRAR